MCFVCVFSLILCLRGLMGFLKFSLATVLLSSFICPTLIGSQMPNSLSTQYQFNHFGVASLAENTYIFFKSMLKLVPVYLKFLKQI